MAMAFPVIFILSVVVSVLNIDFISLGGFLLTKKLVNVQDFKAKRFEAYEISK